MPRPDNIRYGAYGANRNEDLMNALTGSMNLSWYGARFIGYELCLQALGDISDEPVPGLPEELTPRKIIERTWGPGFRAYGMRRAAGKVVVGAVYYLTPLERDVVKEWEMQELGWHVEEPVEATPTSSKAPVFTQLVSDLLPADQPIQRVVNGRNYPDFLNDEDETLERAAQTRLDFLARRAG